MTEMIKLIEPDSPSLKVKLESCSEDLNRMELKMKLIEHMKFYQGIGLSANQIGIMERVFVMYSDVKKREVIACFNPKILDESPKKVLMDEGCLSFPGLWLKVNRPEAIEVEYEDEKGEKIQRELYGLQSRIFQHEYDHMEGSNFTEKVGKVKLDLALKKQKKMNDLTEKLRKKTEENLAKNKEYQQLIS